MTTISNMKYIFLFVLSILFFNLEAQAATITTRQTGNWSDKSTWNGGIVPTASDDVVIGKDFKVTINKNNCKAKSLELSGTLINSDNCQLEISSDFIIINSGYINYGSGNAERTIIVHGDMNIVKCSFRTGNRASLEIGGDINITNITWQGNGTSFYNFKFTGNHQQNINLKNASLNVYNLTINNTSCNGGDNSQGVHIAAGTNIQVTNKLTLAAGVLHLGCDKDNNYALDNHHASGNYLWLSAVNADSYTSNISLPSTSSSRTKMQDRCYVDAYIIVSNENRGIKTTYKDDYYTYYKKTYVLPTGDGIRSGYCAFEYSQRKDLYGHLAVSYNDIKNPIIGDNPQAYAYMAEEYWSFLNLDEDQKMINMYMRIDDSNSDILDFSEETQAGGLAGVYWLRYGNDNQYVWRGWEEFSDESIFYELNDFDSGESVRDIATSGNTVKYLLGNGELYYSYGVKEKFLDQLTSAIESSAGGNLWTGNADTDWNNDANWLDGVPKSTETAKLTNYWSKTVIINIPVSVTGKNGRTNTEYRNVSRTFTVQPEQFPVLNAGDDVASAGSVSITEDDSKDSKAPYLTLNGGALVVANNLSVDNNTEGHIVVNNRYDNSSALKFGNTDYTNLTINRTLEVDRTYYTGSATAEGTFTGVENLNGNNGKSGDYLANYYPNGGGYQKQSDFKYVRGGTFAFFNDATTTHTGTEATLVQVGTPFGTVSGSTNVNDGVIALRSGVGNYDLIENPYLYAFPLDQSGAVSMGTGANRTVWFRRFTDDEGYYWTTYNIGLTGVSEGDTEEDEKEYTLAPQQGFFVKTIATGDENKVVFDPSKITKNNIASGTSVKLKAADAEPDILRLKLSIDGGYSDETAIVFRDGGSMGSVDLESDKWINTTKTRNQIYAVKNDGKQCAIPLYPAISDMQDGEVVNLGVRMSSKSGEGTIRATNIMEFDSDVDVYLHDNETGETIDLRQEDTYAFSAQAGATNNGRFYITLSNKSLPENSEENVEPIADENEGLSTAVADVQTNFIRITSDTERNAIVTLSTNLLSTDAVVNVYDIAGKLIKKQNIDKTETIVPIGLSGVYIVEAISGGQTEKSKVRIR